VAPTQVVQLGEQVPDRHGFCGENPPGRSRPPPLRRGQAAVERFPDHGGDGRTALASQRMNAFITLIVEQ